MLAQSTVDTIKSTIPLLESHGLEITQRFYQHLFETNPELKHVFNLSNQQDASQSRALADAVLAYATHIDNPAVLTPVVQRIAGKHASIGVQAQHYPLVGASLLYAIQEVLKLPDDHPALEAWFKAYGVLAEIFIDTEAALYHNSSHRAGGWEGFRSFSIKKVVAETEEVKSFYLMPVDGQPVARFSGGQYISIKYPAGEDGYEQLRQYSLSSWTADQQAGYRITVKREQKGRQSPLLHHYTAGDTVQLSMPHGQFVLNPKARQHVFIAAGVGITPLFSMTKEAISHGANQDQLLFISCCRGSEHQIFQNELKTLADDGLIELKRAFEFGEGGECSGLLDKETLDNWLTDKSAQVYFCGPLPFMSSMKGLLNSIGFPDEQLHYEVFGPTTAL